MHTHETRSRRVVPARGAAVPRVFELQQSHGWTHHRHAVERELHDLMRHGGVEIGNLPHCSLVADEIVLERGHSHALGPDALSAVEPRACIARQWVEVGREGAVGERAF